MTPVSLFPKEYEDRLLQNAIDLEIFKRKYDESTGKTNIGPHRRFATLLAKYMKPYITGEKSPDEFDHEIMEAAIMEYLTNSKYNTSENIKTNLQKIEDGLLDTESFHDMCKVVMVPFSSRYRARES